MAYEILSSRTRRIPVFNVTGTDYVLRTLPIPDGLNYAQIFLHIQGIFEGKAWL